VKKNGVLGHSNRSSGHLAAHSIGVHVYGGTGELLLFQTLPLWIPTFHGNISRAPSRLNARDFLTLCGSDNSVGSTPQLTGKQLPQCA
jgi:hypothetical protein